MESLAHCLAAISVRPVAPPCECGAVFYSVKRMREHVCMPPAKSDFTKLYGADILDQALEDELDRLDEAIASQEADFVNSPPHYRAGSVECIDAIEAALTPEEFRGYCKGNALKYTWREKHKGKDQDLAKAGWYLSRLSEDRG